MKVSRSGRLASLLGCMLAASGRPADAHSAPFSYVDVRLEERTIDLTVVAHVFDIAHEIGITQSETLLDPAVARDNAARIEALFDQRLHLTDGGTLTAQAWDPLVPLPDRQSIQLHRRLLVPRPSGSIVMTVHLFPYDSQHQTFANFHERGAIQSQALLDHSRTRFEYIVRGPKGVWTAIGRFAVDGARHILTGPDHLIFLIGLLLLGGTLTQMARLSVAFAGAQAVTVAVAAWGWLTPQPRLIEPAIALSIVYVGVDNLLVRDGRDMRVWIAVAFGLIHGFALATLLAGLNLQKQALGWSIFAFTLGVIVGQLLVLATISAALAMLRARSEWVGRRLATAGSVAVMAAGTFWFIQRVFFSGSIS